MHSNRTLFLATSVPFIAFLIGYMATSFYMNQGTIITPNLLGIELTHALDVLEPSKLNIRAVGHTIEPDLPAGTILHQHPMAGTSTKNNQTLFVVTSQRPESTRMPSLLNLKKDVIDSLIAPLATRKKFVYTNSAHETGTCFAQFPSVNSPLDGCELIIMLIAQNNRPFLWPDLGGLSAYEAAEMLNIQAIPFTIRHQESIPADHICFNNCHIVQQRPAPGTIFMMNNSQMPHLALEVIFR